MIESINLEEPVEYICREDRDSDNPTIWKFKPLTYKEECFLKKLSIKNYKDDSGELFIDNASIYLHVSLCGADNFDCEFIRDNKAKCVFEKIHPWSDETISKIPFKNRDELVSFVIKGYSDMEEKDLKN